MTATPATTQLEKARVAHTIREYHHDAHAVADGLGYGAEAAAALGVDPSMVFKTLLVEADGRPGVVIVPVLSRVALKAAASALGAKKAALMDPHKAQKLTGYVVGGISPFGQKRRSPTVVDASARDLPHMLVSGGRRGFDIELAPNDLATVLDATFADITHISPGSQG